MYYSADRPVRVERPAYEALGQLSRLAEWLLVARDYLIVYVDGVQFGGRHLLEVLDVGENGNKRILDSGKALILRLAGRPMLAVRALDSASRVF